MLILNAREIITERFPNNETKVKDFAENIRPDGNILEFYYREDGDLICLMFVGRRINELKVPCTLVIHYMPYSRMDRKIEGDLFTLQYICDYINGLNFVKVIVTEPHSQITMELLERSVAVYPVIDWLPRIMQEMEFGENDRIIFPDKGAAARYRSADYKNVCVFEKTRNPQSGRIEGMNLREGSLNRGAKCIIIDDLCSAGGTFAWAGNVLREMGAADVVLAVSHCEPTVFGGKLLEPESPVSRIYTSTSMMNEKHPKLIYMPVKFEDYV